jgi:hypothetical protein
MEFTLEAPSRVFATKGSAGPKKLGTLVDVVGFALAFASPHSHVHALQRLAGSTLEARVKKFLVP